MSFHQSAQSLYGPKLALASTRSAPFLRQCPAEHITLFYVQMSIILVIQALGKPTNPRFYIIAV